MKRWTCEIIENPVKKAFPILSYPSVQLLGVSVKDLILSSVLQARGMKLIADRTDSAASVSLMDLSVEAECFGAPVRYSDNEIPAVTGNIISSAGQADALKVPKIGSGRTNIYLDAVTKAVEAISDRPVFAGAIGPFSLAGRLTGVSKIMISCYDEPEIVNKVLEKVTEFILAYCLEFKKSGANGVILAEPLAGLLSPSLAEEFSARFVKEIADAVQDDEFIVIYHNCGNGTVRMIDSILSTGCAAYHFGNAIDMAEMMPHIPPGVIAMGNVDPVGEFCNGTTSSIRGRTAEILKKCGSYDNFIISSGCDIPPMAKWENIDEFYKAARDYYTRRR